MKKVLVLVLILNGCASNIKEDDSLIQRDYSLRKYTNTTSFLSSILYFKTSSVVLTFNDKKELDKVIIFEKQYPCVVKAVSYSSSNSISKNRNIEIRKYLTNKIADSQMIFETGKYDEIIVNPNTLIKDSAFSTRTEIFISY